MKKLVQGEVTVLVREGTKTVPAILLGNGLAVHRGFAINSNFWSVTHIKSGYGICLDKRKADAMRIARKLGEVCNWDVEREKLPMANRPFRDSVSAIVRANGRNAVA